ncbi:MAG: hypothetical protein FWF63_06425 [Fibromonadales bacterium]|nr:hypothetical protein [Fibromonadales bacterium]
MRKLLFFSISVILVILGCSNNDDMPCLTCDNQQGSYNNSSGYSTQDSVYCFYYRGGSYKCSYMSVKTCNGGNYGNDRTCGDYLGQDSTYCLYYDNTSHYKCSYMGTRECPGDNYRSDSTCGGYWWSSSSESSSSSGSCDIKDYRTIRIGNQVWMAQNFYCNVFGSKCYNNDPANCSKYGRLYSWATAMGIDTKYNREWWGGSDEKHKGICPTGWHIPSDYEWEVLKDYNKFSALPGGNGNSDGGFGNVGTYGYWWSASESNDETAYNRYMGYDLGFMGWDYGDKSDLLSVRCVKD